MVEEDFVEEIKFKWCRYWQSCRHKNRQSLVIRQNSECFYTLNRYNILNSPKRYVWTPKNKQKFNVNSKTQNFHKKSLKLPFSIFSLNTNNTFEQFSIIIQNKNISNSQWLWLLLILMIYYELFVCVWYYYDIDTIVFFL